MNEVFVEEYIECRKMWGIATSKFEFDLANQFQNKASSLMNQIWALPDNGQTTLTELLAHCNEFVRLGAATGLLSLNETLAKTTLKHLSLKAENEEVCYNAEMVLKEWEAGRLDNVRNRHNKV